jgi:hypothetical protein
MVLTYYGRKFSQTQLIRLLGTTDAGTPFSCLRLLSQLGAAVDSRTNGTLAELQATLPVIVGLRGGCGSVAGMSRKIEPGLSPESRPVRPATALAA